MAQSNVELGCGLSGIGRSQGADPNQVPEHDNAIAFINDALDMGVTFFDTAPAYGLSEERLGLVLQDMPSDERDELTVATKMGEHWNAETGESYTDHSATALVRSIDTSVERLGKIDLLQIHKATPEVLQSRAVHEALEYAQRMYGIGRFGVSVSDVEAADLALGDERFSHIQLPYNEKRAELAPYINWARDSGKSVIVNRPYQSGVVGSAPANLAEQVHPAQRNKLRYKALAFILERSFDGVILTGTTNSNHLQDNIQLFRQAQAAQNQ